MNALAAVDKLDPRECLLAENVRLDETGNIQSSGAFTRQNATAYNGRVHSLYWNPSLGAISGVGTSVFQGPTLGGMASKLSGANAAQQKMSFASAPNRVYFDVGSVGYWSDLNNLLTVDWAPPLAVGATVTGPTAPGTATGSGIGPAWINPNGAVSGTATLTVSNPGAQNSQYLIATMSTSSFAISAAAVVGIAVNFTVTDSIPVLGQQISVSLLKNGVPVGGSRLYNFTASSPANTPIAVTLGNSTDLWNTTWMQGDINSGTFGVQLSISVPGGGVTFTITGLTITIYQGASGFVSGTGAAGTLTGTYQWKVTFVAANGEESDGSGDSALTTLASQQGTLTAIPVGDARTTARNIYRKGNTLTAHYLVGTIQDNVSTTFSDNQTDIAALSAGVILAGDVPGDYPNSRLGSTQVRFPVLHYDRVFWINQNKPNQIIWSKPLNGFAYSSINFINVGDSKPCTRLVSIFGELIIIKTDSIWRLTGTDESSFDLTQTPSAVGTDEAFSVAALPDKVLFHNRWGFWVFNGYTSQPLTPKLDLWMKQDDRTGEELFGVNGFHPPEVVSATVPLNFEAVGNSEKYYFSYAEAGQSANNAVLVFDLRHGNITKRPVGALSLAIDPVNGYVYMGDAAGFVSLLDDWNGATAGGAAVNFDFQHGYQDLQRGSNKALWALEFFLDTDGQTLTPFVYYDNGNASEQLAPLSTTSLQRVVRTCEAVQSRKMQNFSVRLNGNINPVNKSGQPQIQIVHIKAIYDVRTGRARTGQT